MKVVRLEVSETFVWKWLTQHSTGHCTAAGGRRKFITEYCEEKNA